jgi:hypothetical protein
LWTGAIQLGLLDDPSQSPFKDLDMTAIDTPATRQLNFDAAVQSMVLLKNEPPSNADSTPLLPLSSSATVALIGPHFNSTQDLLSDYCPGHWWARSPLMGAQTLLGGKLVGYAQGCQLEGNDTSGIAAAVALAQKADVAVVVVGLTASNDPTNSGTPPVFAKGDAYESEGHDRTQITLQGQQAELVKQVFAANPKTVVVLIHGGALAIEELVEAGVPAVLDAHYGGQMGGDAIWHTLLNHNGAAPAGRLTTTAYKQDFVEYQNMTDMALTNITYQHFTGETNWPFGFGLSVSKLQRLFPTRSNTLYDLLPSTPPFPTQYAVLQVRGHVGEYFGYSYHGNHQLPARGPRELLPRQSPW